MQINSVPEIINASALQERIHDVKTANLIKTNQIIVKRIIY